MRREAIELQRLASVQPAKVTVLRIFLVLVAVLLAAGSEEALSALGGRGGTYEAHAASPHIILAKAARLHKGRKNAPPPEAAAMPPLPERAPPEIRPKSNPNAVNGPEPPAAWDIQEVKAAEEECGRLLAGAPVEFKPLPPIRQGMCGTPWPISLKYVADLARVELRPTATTNCRVAAAFTRWMREVVQPRAWDLLDARVIRVVVMGSYDCRERNGGKGKGLLSQHAFANALDISEFVTAKGEHIRLTEHWSTGDERAEFLHAIHTGACRIFGTVLGPEANEAHRNHFHLDMTPRRHSSVCQ